MNDIYRLSMLLDFYGELLTRNQLDILNEYVNDDLTISEIASNRGISRQGVHEVVKRSEAILEEYEKKLGLINKFILVKLDIKELLTIIEELDINNSFRNEIMLKVQGLLEKL